MKRYENEATFVNMFAKDAKESIKSGNNFTAVWNNIEITITSMDNNNPSKVTVYAGTVNGVVFKGNITALKKRLNITFTKEYNRNSEAAKTANTKVTIKSDDELAATAQTVANRIKDAVNVISKYANRYAIQFDTLVNDGYVTTDDEGKEVSYTAYDMILEELKQERDAAKKEAERKEAEKKEAAAKKEAEKADLLAKIQEASANGNFDLVIELSSKLKALK